MNKFEAKKVLWIHWMSSYIEKNSRKEKIKKFKENWMDLELFQFNRQEDPTYESWEETFKQIDFSKYDAVYANSFWPIATIRFLYDNNIRVKRLVMTVTWKSFNVINWNYKNTKILLDYLEGKELWNIADEIIAISTKDDKVVPYQSWQKIANMTKAKFILLEKWGHLLEWHTDLIINLLKYGK